MHFASCIALGERIPVSHLRSVLDERREVGDVADGSERMIGLREGKGYTGVLAGMVRRVTPKRLLELSMTLRYDTMDGRTIVDTLTGVLRSLGDSAFDLCQVATS